jgi:hypothetical protein
MYRCVNMKGEGFQGVDKVCEHCNCKLKMFMFEGPNCCEKYSQSINDTDPLCTTLEKTFDVNQSKRSEVGNAYTHAWNQSYPCDHAHSTNLTQPYPLVQEVKVMADMLRLCVELHKLVPDDWYTTLQAPPTENPLTGQAVDSMLRPWDAVALTKQGHISSSVHDPRSSLI